MHGSYQMSGPHGIVMVLSSYCQDISIVYSCIILTSHILSYKLSSCFNAQYILPMARLYLYSVLFCNVPVQCTVRNVLSTVTQLLSAVMSHVSRMVRVSQIHVTLRTIKHEQVQQLYMERSIARLCHVSRVTVCLVATS